MRDLLLPALAWAAGGVVAVMTVLLYAHHGIGYDARAYWRAGRVDDPYTLSTPGYADAFLYSPVFAQAMRPLAGVLRTVRAVLLVMVVLHGIALFLLGQGSLPGLVVMGVVWWGLGWLMQSAAQLGGAQASGMNTATQALQDRLRQVAQQRSGTGLGTGKKKP